jgi:hypothetical protein
MITQKFTSKPALLEAVQWVVTHTPSDDAKPVVGWINQNGGSATFIYDFFEDKMRYEPRIIIGNGPVFHAKPGDWIVRDHYGMWWVHENMEFAIPITDESQLDPNTPPQVGME